jgi:Glyoxalase-like domain
MSAIRFDHLITFTSATSIDDYLNEYVAQGFVPHTQTIRHVPGLRNGFISLGPDYLEFWWVEDEAQFTAAGADQQALRTGQRPFGIGMVAQDIHAVHDDWATRGYAVSPVSSRAPRDAPADTPEAAGMGKVNDARASQ